MTKKPQIEKFKEAARAIGADESLERFDNALRRLAGRKGAAQAKKPTPKRGKKNL